MSGRFIARKPGLDCRQWKAVIDAGMFRAPGMLPGMVMASRIAQGMEFDRVKRQVSKL